MKLLQEILNKKGAGLKVDGIIGPKTLEMLQIHIELEFRKYDYPEPGTMLIGLRTDETLSNTFDDFMVYVESGKVRDVWECSTTPGKFYIQNPINTKGSAVLCPGYYSKMWRFTTAQNWATLWLKAPYFAQIGICKVYRDGNKDTVLNKDNFETGYFGINGHRAGTSSIIDRWSAGCQVTPDAKWFKVLRYFKQGQVVDYCLLNFFG